MTPVVQTEAGRVSGLIEPGGTYAFLGVPYAAPVTEARRFEAPAPVEPWAGVRVCDRLGPVCPQLPTYGPVGTAAASDLEQGSDFLSLNIRTPTLFGRAPVLVWIHGGGYAVGSANEPVLQSGAFAASGVVEVTVNYRLGALGFLSLPGKPDNRGLLDQIAALDWVQRNIASFGGDPTQVTFAGRSAGGFAVAAVMAMPAARGLFARAMPQSGASTGLAMPEDAAKLTRRMAAALGTESLGIARAPLQALIAAQRDLCNESYDRHDAARDGRAAMLGVPFVPVIDGDSLPDHPEAAALRGQTAPVPMMIGCTTAEYLTHSTVVPSDLTWGGAAALLDQRVRPLGLTGAQIVARYRTALPDHGPQGLWRAIGGDLVFQAPAIRFARAHADHQPVWKYLWGELAADETGAAHGAEVGEVWYRPGMDQSARPERQRISDPHAAARTHQLWLSFIRGETPATGGVAAPRYTVDEPRLIWLTPGGAEVTRDPFDARVALWRAATDG
ncbi:carboxylesterase family protein [Frigidibacter albus]|uniref:Carboxylesterase family protein n=1 Tax=Frigidibacter albus TaxID=1465486 RepID=A0A6L8VD41_9RHOB|nr:carboxylesterase family protein [Frigidibacter albus]MZQ87542.1 carboxylesterase family protein [Frigidibacter albus]NBE29448.1 carboxylesterase family protein [Frigidibacter albus]GGH44842.1 carboxylic ester hydrolase [Frigidibacter albus]